MRSLILALSLSAIACGDSSEAPFDGGALPGSPDGSDGSSGDGSSGDGNGDGSSGDGSGDGSGLDGAVPDQGGNDASRDGQAPSDDAGEPNLDLPGWKLVWNDEFDGPSGQKPDATRWTAEVGGGGWGNNQQEFDTDRAENASLDGQGMLVLTARKEEYMGRDYTSARLKTQGKFEHGYGRYEARMKLPFGQGIWPAFWMLGTDIGSAGWPGCGEIDIMENIGREPSTVHGTLHGPGYSGGNGIGAGYELDQGEFKDAYHVFAIEWEEGVVRWYVDGELYQTRTPDDLPGSSEWVYDHDFFILLNLAVGGLWPGYPDDSSTFPQELKVDYVRVYERE